MFNPGVLLSTNREDLRDLPYARVITRLLVALISGVVLWACLMQVEISAPARGKIIPAERTKLVQAPQSGIIKAVHVRDGDLVERGKPLLDLDHTELAAEAQKLYAQKELLLLRATRVHDLLEHDFSAADLRLPKRHLTRADSVKDMQEPLILAQLQSLQSGLESVAKSMSESEARRNQLERKLSLTKAIIAELTAKIQREDELRDRQFLSRASGVADKILLMDRELEHDTLFGDAQIEQVKLQRLELERRRVVDDFHAALLQQLEQIKHEQDQVEQSITAVRSRIQRNVIRAPTTGYVEDLKTYTTGGALAAGETLLKIVPKDGPTMVEASLDNKDLGFIETGQLVRVKIDAYPFARYGWLNGSVVDVSHDSALRESAPFVLRISLDEGYLSTNGQRMPLRVGMTVVADVVTGKRTVASYLVDPILETIAGGLRER